jgi:hypothetical protein
LLEESPSSTTAVVRVLLFESRDQGCERGWETGHPADAGAIGFKPEVRHARWAMHARTVRRRRAHKACVDPAAGSVLPSPAKGGARAT